MEDFVDHSVLEEEEGLIRFELGYICDLGLTENVDYLRVLK
jgi:hypothetical protein